MIQKMYVGLVAAVLAGPSSAFSPSTHPPRLASRPQSTADASSSALPLSAGDDDVATLLAEAKRLKAEARRRREEIAVMSGKTTEEMEREVLQEKQRARQRTEITEKARLERGEGRTRSKTSVLPVPEDATSQVQQAAAAVERAFADGLTRQTVRFALLEEEEAMSGEQNEWPGGVQQMYRRAGRPLAESLLREVRAYADTAPEEAVPSNTPPAVSAEDIWDFDGSAILSAKAAGGSHGDVKAVVFPNTDTKYLNVIEALARDVGEERLLLLVNPFWKDVESWGFNILAPNGKKRAQEVLFDNGYDVTYAVLRFSVRGEDCVALKAYPYEWQMYAYREDPAWFNQERPVWLGASAEEPRSAQISALLNGRPEFKMSKNMRQMQRMMGNDDK